MNIHKILINVFSSLENFVQYCKDENLIINAFNSLKSNLLKEFSPNLYSFKGYVESLNTPYYKIEKTLTNLSENVDLNMFTEYLLKRGKYSKCIDCGRVKKEGEFKRLECNCYLCLDHSYTRFDINFHFKKTHIK